MRWVLVSSVSVALALAGLLACNQLDPSAGSGDADGGAASAAATTADASVSGAACGIESNTHVQLCAAVSTCPTVVVDTQAMPHCGFRIHGATADLVCACGTSLCPMGSFSSCTEATQLLTNQTEQNVCVQLAEGRCVEPVEATSSSSSTTSSSTSSGGNPACDKECVANCGGGAACASVCNCS